MECFRAEVTRNPLRHDLLLRVGARVVLPQGLVRGQVGVAGDAWEPLLISINRIYNLQLNEIEIDYTNHTWKQNGESI